MMRDAEHKAYCRYVQLNMKPWAPLLRIFLLLTLLCIIAVYVLYTHPCRIKMEAAPQRPASLSQRNHKTPVLPRTLPYAECLKSIDDIRRAPWVTRLYKYLKRLNHSISPHVNMVFGDSNHTEMVLNWTLAAHVRLSPPLHNIMVLSVDQPLCDFLASKKLPVACIAVPPESFLASTGPESYNQGIKTRLLVLRVMNFWGYDVASYDCDAVLLRNPQHFFNDNPDVQMFTGIGRVPQEVSRNWGFAICAGTLIVRSDRSTENLWKTIHHLEGDESEQFIVNVAVKDLGVKWNATTTRDRLCKVRSGWQSDESLASIVFPTNIFCRICSHTDSSRVACYLVHPIAPHGVTFKRQMLKKMKGWFLQDDWKKLTRLPQKSNSWLRRIYVS